MSNEQYTTFPHGEQYILSIHTCGPTSESRRRAGLRICTIGTAPRARCIHIGWSSALAIPSWFHVYHSLKSRIFEDEFWYKKLFSRSDPSLVLGSHRRCRQWDLTHETRSVDHARVPQCPFNTTSKNAKYTSSQTIRAHCHQQATKRALETAL